MRSLSGVGLGLSLVFGCLLFALVIELYYLLWWKKQRLTNRDIEVDYTSPTREFLYYYTLCWKKPSSLSSTTTAFEPQQQQLCSSITISDTTHHVHESQNNEFWLKPFGEDSELMRLQMGPPGFLFTIKEETKEDLESEDGKGKSLNDLLVRVETPFLTPLESPSCFTPPLTPMDSASPLYNKSKNPKFESCSDAEFNRIRASPPPKFKFLRDAEEKLHRKLMDDEAEKRVHEEEQNCSSVTLIVAN